MFGIGFFELLIVGGILMGGIAGMVILFLVIRTDTRHDGRRDDSRGD